MKNVAKLEDYELWKLSSHVTKFMLATLEKYPEEIQYPMDFRLREASIYITTNTAASFGSIDPRDKVWQLGKMRSSLYELKSIYKLMHDTKIVTLDPQVMVDINNISDIVTKEISDERLHIKDWYSEMSAPVKESVA